MALLIGIAAAALLPGCRSIEEPGAPFVADPLAPNWHIEELDLGADRYAFALTKKRLVTGGDGEAMTVLRRRIERIAREKGYTRFELVEYSEGIDSYLPIAQRVAHGTVQFAGAPAVQAPPKR